MKSAEEIAQHIKELKYQPFQLVGGYKYNGDIEYSDITKLVSLYYSTETDRQQQMFNLVQRQVVELLKTKHKFYIK